MAKPPVRVDLALHPDVLLDDRALRAAAVNEARVRDADVRAVRVIRRAIDARRGRVLVQTLVELDFEPPNDEPVLPVDLPTLDGAPSVVIVGAGPAGLFAAWALARHGVRSVIVERGKSVRPRRRDLAALTQRGALNPDSNYCFGEGGAGTFSDGKLYTRSSKRGDVESVLRAFVAYGANPDILVDARPHIGTNKLPGVVTAMREHLESAGVEVLFETRVDAIRTAGGRATGVVLSDGRVLEARAVVVAPGHSARDVQRFVADAGARVTFKSFAIGVRVEHAQSFVDRLQFGPLAGHPVLGAASYRIVERACGTGIFSFCMCPGGFVAPAATEPGGQVVNGWSPSKRNGKFANSGFVTEIGPTQLATFGFDPEDPFAGVELQRRIERRAYEAGGGDYVAPAQRIADFVERRPSSSLPATSYPRPVASARLDDVLESLAEPLRQALLQIDRKMRGYARGDAVALGVESRTSSPVRMERDRETLEAVGLAGLYPCGEGAGFAGGIMSAALDGIRVADAIARR
ncbi:MAG: FAD-dependent oxidoreductase [Polyangiales bacterium]